MKMSADATSDTTARIERILRTELRLGEEAEIGADTPLAGGEYDLDSLDMLMIVTAVEKDFGLKIPSEDLSREAFATVGTLARFIDERRGA
jgi:acyl carrier protein